MNTAIALARNRKNKKTQWLVMSVFLWSSWVSVDALAQSPPVTPTPTDDSQRRAAAEALFDDAKSLMKAGRVSEACPKFAASQAMDPAVGTRLNLADCLEKLRHTASAWAEFRAAAAAARAKGQTDRAEIAKRRAANLEHELVRLSVFVPTGSSEAVEIRKNGSTLERGSWGAALPVDPGRYVIVASISGKTVYRTEVNVPDKPGTHVTTTLPVLEESSISKRRVQRGFAITLGTVSVASLIAGSALGVSAIGHNSDSKTHCRGNQCDAKGVTLRQDALTFGNAATAAFAIGAATGIGAVVLHVTMPPLEVPPTKIGFGVVNSGVGLIVGGAF
jgi:hypothetical protein